MSSRVDVTAQRVHALLRLAGGNEGWTVSFDADGDLPLGLRVHSGKRDSFLRTAMRKAGGSVIRNARMVRFEPPQRDEVEELARQLFQQLVRVAKEPIGPKVVEKLLEITPGERTRWTKNGIIASSGAAQVGRGRASVWVPTYSPVVIERLLAEPAIIGTWRAEDEGD